MRTATLLPCILIVLASGSLYADYISGNDLRKFIAADTKAGKAQQPSGQSLHESGVARGYVAGIQDAFNGIRFCVHEDVELSQAVALVAKYLDDHPEAWHLAGKQIVINALHQHFPCSK